MEELFGTNSDDSDERPRKIARISKVETITNVDDEKNECETPDEKDCNLPFTKEEGVIKKTIKTAISASSFLFRSPVSNTEANLSAKEVRHRIEEAQSIIAEHGYEYYRNQQLANNAGQNCHDDDDDGEDDPILKREQELADAVVRGNPRAYQTALFELAKKQNTIVHLGTGQGKTLIALLCIKHFTEIAAQTNKHTQTLFLVPSIALAVQHTTTLQANLPYKVSTACHTSAKSVQARTDLKNSDIIVATHGAAKDLFMHYSDLFHFENIHLIVVDECHYATGDHGYAKIFEKFYRRLPIDQRPRVIGLTASPLLNVKGNIPNSKLQEMLNDLESKLDSTLACFRLLNLNTNENGEKTNYISRIYKNAQERVINYSSSHSNFPDLPDHNLLPLHFSRIKEFNQLLDLYNDLGPLCTAIYSKTLSKEVSRNRYEQESQEQFQCVIKHLKRVSDFCWKISTEHDHGGRTEKLALLEELLEDTIENNKSSSNTVGVVFVDRRITALALYDYFRVRTKRIQDGTWIRISKTKWTRQSEPHDYQAPTSNIQNENKLCKNDLVLDYSTSKFEGTTKYNKKEMIDNIIHDVVQSCIPPGIDPKQLDEITLPPKIKSLNNSERFTNNENDLEIKCDMLVRHSTQVFKYLDKSFSMITAEEEKLEQDTWLHQMTKVREVLDRLRRKEINVLIATSVVEEGVDVDACSFVIVFDHLKSTKSYVQMKGRARQKDAKFYVFQNCDPETRGKHMTLSMAQEIEKRVSDFIETREASVLPRSLITPKLGSAFLQGNLKTFSDEEIAVEQREYKAPSGMVDLCDSRSLLNRYTLSIPMEPCSRSTKEILLLHMPVFEDHRLFLPAHLPSSVRCVNLPEQYKNRSKKEKSSIMALMACVRLHKLNLLNDRLLPLKKKDMQEKLLSIALTKLIVAGERKALLSPPTTETDYKDVFIYPLLQSGHIFSQNDAALQGNAGRVLAIVCLSEFGDIPVFKFEHPELREIYCKLGNAKRIRLNGNQWLTCVRFYTTLINVRWRRRTGTFWYEYNLAKAQDGVVDPYAIASLTSNGEIDWTRMERTVNNFARTDEQKIAAVRDLDSDHDLQEPRIWSPIYDKFTSYIVYGPSNLTCSAPFPDNLEDVKTYQDYVVKKRNFEVNAESRLFCVQRQWHLPRRVRQEFISPTLFEKWKSKNIEPELTSRDEVHLQPGEKSPCDGLIAALLPQHACMEAPISDASLFLHCLILPQILYYLSHVSTAFALIQYCENHLPKMASCLSNVPLEELLEAITARSCAISNFNYDKLEWLGDAVLKLIHTDALLCSKDLRKWVGFLHEGDLTQLRSAMGRNSRLMEAAKSSGLERFILILQLGRGQWAPICLELCTIDDEGKEVKCKMNNYSPGKKTCADVIESLLGLAYIRCGYRAAFDIADELGITLPLDDYSNDTLMPNKVSNKTFLDVAESFLNTTEFRDSSLIKEALTHPSCIHEEVPCYQRLEWVGDAALCLFAREWVYKKFTSLHVSEMDLIETTIVCNETLAYLNVLNGLQRYINHRDPTIPGRIENFEWSVSPNGRCLWSTDPPKALPDVVEALFGAVHVDAGFSAGQVAIAYAMNPILEALSSAFANMTHDELCRKARSLMHPKQFIHEFKGGMVQVKMFNEDSFARKKSHVKVWNDGILGNAVFSRNNYVGLIHSYGIDLFGVSEFSSHLASNRACVIAAEVLTNNSDLVESLQKLSLMSKPSKNTKEEENRTETNSSGDEK